MVDPTIDEAGAYEIPSAWIFPPRRSTDIWDTEFGASSVVVNKKTGVTMSAGRHFRPDLYEKGYQFDVYDLVVLEVHNLKRAVSALLELNLSEVLLSYGTRTVWRCRRTLTRSDLVNRLDRLPRIFPRVRLLEGLDALEDAREDGAIKTIALAAPRHHTAY